VRVRYQVSGPLSVERRRELWSPKPKGIESLISKFSPTTISDLGSRPLVRGIGHHPLHVPRVRRTRRHAKSAPSSKTPLPPNPSGKVMTRTRQPRKPTAESQRGHRRSSYVRNQISCKEVTRLAMRGSGPTRTSACTAACCPVDERVRVDHRNRRSRPRGGVYPALITGNSRCRRARS
jgi:hypothetical protein